MKALVITLFITAAFVLSTQAAPPVDALWNKNCASCHGKDGKGETKAGKKAGVKDMTDAGYQAALKDDAAFEAIKNGLEKDGKSLMKPFKDKLSDDEIKQLIAHVRTFKQ